MSSPKEMPCERESEARKENRFRAWWERNKIRFLLPLLSLFFLLIYLAPRILISIHSGEAGVLWKRFAQGTVTNLVYSEGMHIIFPWDTMTIYDVRVQNREQSVVVISTNGLSVAVDVSIRYSPKIPLLGRLHKGLGPDYANKIIVPEVQALLRDLYGQYTPEEIYTTKRSFIQDSLSRAVGEMGESYVSVDDLLIKSIRLPAALQEAIEAKLTQEQRQLEMKYRIAREELEVERKLTEAYGISGYNQIVGNSLTESLLTFKGIDASLELAKSPNAKMVIFGNKEGLPVILDSRMPDPAPTPGSFESRLPGPGATSTNKLLIPSNMTPSMTNALFPDTGPFMPRLKEWVRTSTNSVRSLLESIRRPRD